MESALIDTNIALRLFDHTGDRFMEVLDVVSELLPRQRVVICPQVLYETYAVSIRPKLANGYGLTPEEASVRIENLRQFLDFVPDPISLSDEWLSLCRNHAVSGKTSHDARIVAFLKAANLDVLLTMNGADFRRYGISLIEI